MAKKEEAVQPAETPTPVPLKIESDTLAFFGRQPVLVEQTKQGLAGRIPKFDVEQDDPAKAVKANMSPGAIRQLFNSARTSRQVLRWMSKYGTGYVEIAARDDAKALFASAKPKDSDNKPLRVATVQDGQALELGTGESK